MLTSLTFSPNSLSSELYFLVWKTLAAFLHHHNQPQAKLLAAFVEQAFIPCTQRNTQWLLIIMQREILICRIDNLCLASLHELSHWSCETVCLRDVIHISKRRKMFGSQYTMRHTRPSNLFQAGCCYKMAVVRESLEGKKKKVGNPLENVEHKKCISLVDFQTFRMLFYLACEPSANRNTVFCNLNRQHWCKTM